MTHHKIVTRERWQAARGVLMEREKEHTRMGDELARQRRSLPWVRVEKEYTLQTVAGPKTQAELFDGRSQLLIYHFMFGPSSTGPRATRAIDTDVGFSSSLEQTRKAIAPILDQLPLVAFRNAKDARTDIYGYRTELFGFTAFSLEDGVIYQTYFDDGSRSRVPDAVLRVPRPRAEGPGRGRGMAALDPTARRLRQRASSPARRL